MSRRQSHTQPYRRQGRKQDNSSQPQKENTGRTKNKQNNTTLSVQTVDAELEEELETQALTLNAAAAF